MENDIDKSGQSGAAKVGQKDFYRLEIFKAGDYSKYNRPNFTVEDNKEIVKQFRRDHETKNKTIPLILSKDPLNPHNLDGALELGEITDLYLLSDGIINGNGKYNDGYGGLYDRFPGKSAGFVRDAENPDKWVIDHVAVTLGDSAIIQDLIPNNHVLFAKSGIKKDVMYIPFEDQPGGKEVNDMTETKKKEPESATFSKSELDEMIKDAVTTQTANFATEIASLKAENELLKSKMEEKDGIIEAGKKTIDDLGAQVAEFAKKKEGEAYDELKSRVYALEGLEADKKNALLTKLANFAKIGQSEAAEDLLAQYEAMTAIRKDNNAEFSKINRAEIPSNKSVMAFRIQNSDGKSQVVPVN